MLKVMRDSMKYLAWILWAVIAVFVLFVFVDFGSSVPRGNLPTQAAATVGDMEVSYGDFRRAYRNLEDQMRQRLGDQYTPELAEQLRLPLQALDRLINEQVLLSEAERMELSVSDQEVRRTILEMPVFAREDGTFVGPELYRRALRSLGYSPEEFEDAVRRQVLVERLTDALRNTVVVSDAEVEEQYRERNDRAKIHYLVLPFDPSAVAAPTPQEVERTFETHRESYRLPERRVAQFVLVETAKLRDGVTLDPQEVETYYRDHRNDFAQKEQVRARHILARIDKDQDQAAAEAKIAKAKERLAAGEDFATVARELSDDPGSGARGGDLGFFGRGRMVKPFEDAAFGAKVGELVGPVRSTFGLHLIEVLERREARVPPLEEIRAQVETRIKNERAAALAEEKAKALYAQLAALPTVDRAALQGVTSDGAVSFGETPPVERQGVAGPLGPAPDVNRTLFELSEGGLSQPVRVPRGWAILRLEAIQPPALPELDQVRSRVEADARQEKAAVVARARLDKARAAIARGATLEAEAKALSVEVKEGDVYLRRGTVVGLGTNAELADAVAATEVGGVGGPVTHQRSAVLFQVDERTDFDPAAFAEQKDQLRDELRAQQSEELLRSLVAQRRKELGVRYDRQLLESFKLVGEEAPAT